jgi:hypothetical protein
LHDFEVIGLTLMMRSRGGRGPGGGTLNPTKFG